MKKIIFLFILVFTFSSFLQEENTIDVNQQLIDDKIVLVFAGDIMGHSPQFKAAYSALNDQFNYNPCFKFVKPYIQDADFAFVNLEVTLAGKPYSGYPNFSSPDELLDATKNAGFDIILTANNHVADRGKKGLERTLHTIQNRYLKYAGSYLSNDHRDSIYPLLLNHKGFSIAILNCTYGTNMNPVHYPNIVNMLDSAQVLTDIKRAKYLNVDYIVAFLHWGNEYELKANKSQEDFANFLAANGVDLIIGSHPHVIQNADFINVSNKNVPVVYSLGNFISNQRNENTNGGIIAKIEISKRNKNVSSVEYLPVYVHRGKLNGLYQYYLIPTTDYIIMPSKYQIPQADSTILRKFDFETRKRLQNISVWNKYLK